MPVFDSVLIDVKTRRVRVFVQVKHHGKRTFTQGTSDNFGLLGVKCGKIPVDVDASLVEPDIMGPAPWIYQGDNIKGDVLIFFRAAGNSFNKAQRAFGPCRLIAVKSGTE